MFFFFAEAHQQIGLVEVLFDFKSNVINWLLLVGFLIYGWNKLVPNMMAQRARTIEDSISSAKKAKTESEQFLLDQKQKIADMEKQSAKIVAEAKTVGQQLKAEIEARTKREIADMERKFEAAIANERQVIISEVRTAAVKAAIQLSRSYLENNVSPEDNKRLLTQFMQELDSLSGGQSYAPGTVLGAASHSDK